MPHVPDRHADHDPLAIAAYAAGDATGPALDAAIALVAACPDCALLHHDLRAIAAALPTLPAPVRPRDFRLTPDAAAALRPAGWRRWLAPLAGPRFAFAGPLGTGLATLGIAGILVAGAAGTPLVPAAGGAAGAAAPATAGGQEVGAAPELAPLVAASAAPASEAPASMAPASPVPAGSPGPDMRYSTMASVPPGTASATDGAAPSAAPIASGDMMTSAGGSRVASIPTPTGMPKDAAAIATNDPPPADADADATRDALSPGRGWFAGPAAPLAAVALVVLAAGVLLAGLRVAARRLA